MAVCAVASAWDRYGRAEQVCCRTWWMDRIRPAETYLLG